MPDSSQDQDLYAIEVEGRLNLLLLIIEGYRLGVITRLELIQYLVEILHQLD